MIVSYLKVVELNMNGKQIEIGESS